MITTLTFRVGKWSLWRRGRHSDFTIFCRSYRDEKIGQPDNSDRRAFALARHGRLGHRGARARGSVGLERVKQRAHWN